jgi:hypothetical protein
VSKSGISTEDSLLFDTETRPRFFGAALGLAVLEDAKLLDRTLEEAPLAASAFAATVETTTSFVTSTRQHEAGIFSIARMAEVNSGY